MANWDEENTTAFDNNSLNWVMQPGGQGSLDQIKQFFPGPDEQVIQDFITSHPGTTYDPATRTFTSAGNPALDLGRGGQSNLFDKLVAAGIMGGFGMAGAGVLGSTFGGMNPGTASVADASWGVNPRDIFSGGGTTSGVTGFDPTTGLSGQTAGSWAGDVAGGSSATGIPSVGGTSLGTTGFDTGGLLGTSNSAQSPIGGGNSLNDFLQGWGTNPGQVASTAYNLWSQQQMANRLGGAAQNALNAGQAPINQAQRLPYQVDLLNLINNPQDFFRTNPQFLAQADTARNMFNAAAAKSGMGGTSINDYMGNIMNVGANTYNQQVQNLAGLGGFTQGGGTAGSAYGGLATGAAGQQGAGVAGVAPLINNLANSPQGQSAYDSVANLFGQQSSPVSGASTINI